MASIVRIKRSEVSGNPSTLGQGELAYSALPDNGVNGGDRLYIGMGTETNGNAVNHIVIGGKYFTDIINAATSTNTGSTLVKRDASGNFSAGTITAALSGNASTATKWISARDLSLTGDATATLSAVDGSANVSAAITLATVNTNVGTFGSASSIPVITTNAKGLITGVTTAAVASNLNIAGDTGTDAVSLLTDTLSFTGGTGITSSVTNNVVTFDIDSTVALKANKLSVFAATTSAELASVISDETGSGALVFANSPTLVAPNIGAATATSVNKLNIVAPVTSATLNIANGATLATTGAYVVTLNSTANSTVTLPTSGTLATLAGAETLTSKTISGASNTLTNIGNSSLTNSSVTIGSTNVALGATATSLAGLTEVTVDNININGNTISSIDANGDIVIAPNGSGNVDVSNSRIIGVTTPVNDNDAANKLYVDTVAAQGLHVQDGVDAATTNTLAVLSGGIVTYSNGTAGVGATLTTTGSYATGNPIDGVNLAAIGYGVARVLVKNETNQVHNGIYILTSPTVLTRDPVFDDDADIQGGDFVFVVEGAVNASTGWVQTATVNVIGTDPIVWTQFSGAGTYLADGGLTLVGNTFAVGQGLGITVNANDVALAASVAGAGLTYTSGVLAVGGTANRITVSADAIDIASTYAGQSSITTVGTITSGTWNGTTIAVANGGTGLTSITSRGIMFGNNGSAVGVTSASAIDGSFLREDSTGNPYWSNSIDGGTY
jgi:hypothetical protein